MAGDGSDDSSDGVLIDADQDELLSFLMADEPLYSAQVPARASPAASPAVAARSILCAADFAAEFQERFRGREPVLLRGLAAAWPAVAQWSDTKSFSALLGDQDVDVLTAKVPVSRRFLKADCNVERRPFAEVVREVFARSGMQDHHCRNSPAKLAGAVLSIPDGFAAGMDVPSPSPVGRPSRRLYVRAPLSGGLAADVVLADLAALLPGSSPPGPQPSGDGGLELALEREGSPCDEKQPDHADVRAISHSSPHRRTAPVPSFESPLTRGGGEPATRQEWPHASPKPRDHEAALPPGHIVHRIEHNISTRCGATSDFPPRQERPDDSLSTSPLTICLPAPSLSPRTTHSSSTHVDSSPSRSDGAGGSPQPRAHGAATAPLHVAPRVGASQLGAYATGREERGREGDQLYSGTDTEVQKSEQPSFSGAGGGGGWVGSLPSRVGWRVKEHEGGATPDDGGCVGVLGQALRQSPQPAVCRCGDARDGECAQAGDRDPTTISPSTPSARIEAGGQAHAASAAAVPQFKLANCGVWVGSAGNLTPLHYDLCHGFLVGVIGTKVVSYFGGATYSDQDEVDYSRCMYRRDDAPELSNVDLDAWRCGAGVAARDAEWRRHPRFGRAVHRVVELRPGDVLYTPPFCWHHVETTADGPAVSVLVPFDQTQAEASASLLAAHYA